MWTRSLGLVSGAVARPTMARNPDATAQTIGGGVGLLIGLLIVVAIGAIAGWLASLIVRGSGSGLLMDIVIGIAGSLIAGFLLPMVGLQVGSVVGVILGAIQGAVVLLLIVRLIRRG